MNDNGQIVVNESSKGAAVASAAQQLALIVGTVATIAGAAPAGTLMRVVNVAASGSGGVAISAAATLGVGLFGVFRSIFKHKQKVALADAAPNAVAVVARK